MSLCPSKHRHFEYNDVVAVTGLEALTKVNRDVIRILGIDIHVVLGKPSMDAINPKCYNLLNKIQEAKKWQDMLAQSRSKL